MRDLRPGYRADIDGLRAIAVASVVFFHAAIAPFRSGFVGVDIFFVISGYLIGGIILREAGEKRFRLSRFYARRARRILPALVLVILATCLAGWFLLDANEFKDVGVTGMLALLGVSNINFWQFQDYFASDSRLRTLLMTWSLGVEEQFYLIFPFIVIATLRMGRAALVPVLFGLALLSLAASLWWTWTAPVAAFYLLPARAWELGIGAILAAAEARRSQRFHGGLGFAPALQNALAGAGLAALVVGIVAFDERDPFPGILVFLPVFGTAALIASPASWINRTLLASRPVVFVGVVSFSWYLWHWPLMSFLRTLVPSGPSPAALAGAAAASFGLAVLSWWFVERPFRHAELAPRLVLLRYAAVVAAAILVPVAIKASGGFPSRLPDPARYLEALTADLRRSQCLVSTGHRLDDAPACRSFPEGRPVVALFGDSHAWALQPGLRQIAGDQGYGTEILARAACPPVLGVSVRSKSYPTLITDCPAFKAEALRTIASDPRVAVVLLAGYWFAPMPDSPREGYVAEDGSPAIGDGLTLMRDGLDRMITALTAAHKRVIVMQDVPDLGFSPLAIALANSMPLRGAIAARFDPDVTQMQAGWVAAARVPRHDAVRRAIADLVAGRAGVSLVDPLPDFCTATRCVFDEAGKPLFFDKDHLSPLGSARALRGLRLDDGDGDTSSIR